MKNIVLILFLHVSLGVYSQNIATKTILWNTNRTIDISNGSITPEFNKVITYRSDSVTWSDARGVMKYSFQVKGVNGNWDDGSGTGKVNYQLVGSHATGTLTLINSKNKMRISFALRINGQPIFFDLVVDDFQILR